MGLLGAVRAVGSGTWGVAKGIGKGALAVSKFGLKTTGNIVLTTGYVACKTIKHADVVLTAAAFGAKYYGDNDLALTAALAAIVFSRVKQATPSKESTVSLMNKMLSYFYNKNKKAESNFGIWDKVLVGGTAAAVGYAALNYTSYETPILLATTNLFAIRRIKQLNQEIKQLKQEIVKGYWTKLLAKRAISRVQEYADQKDQLEEQRDQLQGACEGFAEENDKLNQQVTDSAAELAKSKDETARLQTALAASERRREAVVRHVFGRGTEGYAAAAPVAYVSEGDRRASEILRPPSRFGDGSARPAGSAGSTGAGVGSAVGSDGSEAGSEY